MADLSLFLRRLHELISSQMDLQYDDESPARAEKNKMFDSKTSCQPLDPVRDPSSQLCSINSSNCKEKATLHPSDAHINSHTSE